MHVTLPHLVRHRAPVWHAPVHKVMRPSHWFHPAYHRSYRSYHGTSHHHGSWSSFAHMWWSRFGWRR